MMKPRKNTRRLTLLSIILTFCGSLVFGQMPDKPLKLLPNKPIEREIKGGETHTFQFELKKGEYARAEVEQKDIDVIVSLFDADGKLVVEMDGKYGFLWREAVSAVAETGDAVFQVKIRAYDSEEQIGNYTIKLAEVRPVNAKDRQRQAAEQHFYKGRKLFLQDKSDYENALKEYEAALKIWQELKVKDWHAITLYQLARTNNSLSKNELALQQMNEADLFFLEANDSIGQGRTKFALGFIYEGLSQFEKQIKSLEEALEIRKKLNDKRAEGHILYYLGFAYFNLKQYEKATNYLKQSSIVKKEIKDIEGEGNIHWNLGAFYKTMKQFDDSNLHFNQSLEIYKKLKNKEGERKSLFGIAVNYIDLKQIENVINYLEKILAIDRETKNIKEEVSTLQFLAGFHRQIKQYGKAINYYETALLVVKENKDKRQEIVINKNLAEIYGIFGRWEKVKTHYEQALIVARELKNEREYSDLLNNLGRANSFLNNYDEAINLYEQSLTIKRNIRDRKGEISALWGLAFIYEKLNQYEKVIENYEKVLSIHKETKNRIGEATVLETVGDLLLKFGQFEKAKNYYDTALSIHKELNNIKGERGLLWDLALLSEKLGQYEKAKGQFEKALLFEKELNDPIRIAIHTLQLSLFYERHHDLEIAILYGKESVKAFQKLRVSIQNLDTSLQKGFLDQIAPLYRRLANLFISKGRLAEAQAVLNLLKEEEYEQISVRRSGENADTVPYSKAEAEAIAKIDKLAELGRRKTELEKQEKDKGSLTEAERKELDKIFADIEAANKAFRESLEKLKNSEASIEDKIAEVENQQGLQSILAELSKEHHTGAVAIYTVIGNDTEKVANGKENQDKTRSKFGWVILVTPDSRKAYPIDVKGLEETVFQFRGALSNDRYDPQPLAEKLYAAIFRQTSDKQKQTLEADLEKLLGNYKDKTIMWSLDGVLRYIPMAALHDGQNYLVEKYRHIVFNNKSLLNFSKKDKDNWQALGLGVSEAKTVKDSLGERDINFDAIPGTEKEINDIVKTSKEDAGFFDGAILLNKDFTKDETISLWRRGKYPVIHIASHFSFNPVDQTASFLLIGDGKLTFADIKDKDNLFGTVDLLTISACDTAMSSNGKESEGFAYLAQSLGAKTVLASLWKVSDAGTPELMIRFYKIRSENPQLSKGEAFRLAQLFLLNGQNEIANTKFEPVIRSTKVKTNDKLELPGWDAEKHPPLAHPFYWSSFVLIGNWR